jgi:hypothetical protein
MWVQFLKEGQVWYVSTSPPSEKEKPGCRIGITPMGSFSLIVSFIACCPILALFSCHREDQPGGGSLLPFLLSSGRLA